MNNNDSISRKAAIEALMNYEPTAILAIINVIDKDAARAIIEDLPSAQPEIIRCEDCEFGRWDVFERGMWCTRHPEYDVEKNDFCSRAKRRSEQDE